MNYLKIIAIISLAILVGCKEKSETKDSSQDLVKNHQKEVLLIGTFHYHNPGADVVKTKSFDILSNDSQIELEQITSEIKDYNPDKIFVEWPHNRQRKLDSLYNLYREGTYFDNKNLSDFYLKNEIFQLAFRVAKANDLEKVYAIDYLKTKFPYGDVMKDIEENKQFELKEKIENAMSIFTTEFDGMIESGTSLKELTYAMNTEEMRYASNDIHNNKLSLAGSTSDFNGVLLTSEWYKRNLYMWSLIQKNTIKSDERIMVLAGASHAAMFEVFIKGNLDWKVKELKDVLRKK